METIAFRMILKPGHAEEYRRCHDAIWPELSELLASAGVVDYTIWLDEETHHLFAVLKCRDGKRIEALASDPVVRRWWDYMADIMVTLPDNAPVQIPLVEMFHMERPS